MYTIILLILLLLLAVSAYYWGYDSTDGPNHEEWQRKHNYPRHL